MIVYNHDEVFIKHYVYIRYMDNNKINIDMGNYDITIKGSHFVMIYFDHNELKIKGKFKVIEYHENRV